MAALASIGWRVAEGLWQIRNMVAWWRRVRKKAGLRTHAEDCRGLPNFCHEILWNRIRKRFSPRREDRNLAARGIKAVFEIKAPHGDPANHAWCRAFL
jgi:hypothetical protein